jgi:hypothetical protein
VTEPTQLFGHSTSGNHERYKSAARLGTGVNCLPKMREWILERGPRLRNFWTDRGVRRRRAGSSRRAWDALRRPIEEERKTALSVIEVIDSTHAAARTLAEMDALAARHHGGCHRGLLTAETSHRSVPQHYGSGSRSGRDQSWLAMVSSSQRVCSLGSQSPSSLRYPDNPTILKGLGSRQPRCGI